jgi:hypothetical protein
VEDTIWSVRLPWGNPTVASEKLWASLERAAGDLGSRKIGSGRRMSVADLERYVDSLGD